MPGIHTESQFEAAIERELVHYSGYQARPAIHFDASMGMDGEQLLAFVTESQPEAWAQLQARHKTLVEAKFLRRVHEAIQKQGLLSALRHELIDMGVRFRLAYFQPETGLNPETQRLYRLNRLDVMRQVHYSTQNQNSLDLVLLLNGLPVVTAELKNPMTGQTAEDARRQYIEYRDPRELMFQFNRRSLVHFAVDDEQAWFTTRLAWKKTRYFPFNKGNGTAAGNPPSEDYRTAYLWREVWQRDSLLDLIGRFLHLQVETYHQEGKTRRKETMIFPRYHQMDVVRRLTRDAREQGAGRHYLVQHSAGSGKSNSIAWLAYRLSNLHNEQDAKVFDSVIVITDRRVLDSQLQDTIYQFEHKMGAVQKIDAHSGQLAQAIAEGAPIIITTLQKFPFVLDKVGALPRRRYAVIVDEAHSSQGGEASKQMKQVLSATEGQDPSEDYEDEIRRSMEARGIQPNLSFFAFTATPKAKTLAVFGEEGADGKHRPFHMYSMRQAIQEGFILDVLRHYTTYKTYFKLRKAIEEDPELNKKKAARAIGRYLALHPYNISQKVTVMVEHFRQVTMHKIGGKAKAMLVAGSREQALRYYWAFNEYIRERGYEGLRALVAFSGVLELDGENYRESQLNDIREKQLPEYFKTDVYQVLIVADKYQTGFDEPLLHTMFVDKALSGVKAVQTLSRLNRTRPGKEDTFVLDFANDAETIQEAFAPYYEVTRLDEPTNPNHLYDLLQELEEAQVYTQEEVEAFAKVWFRPRQALTKSEHKQLYRFLRPAIDRYRGRPEEEQDAFKKALTAFLRTYSTLSQYMPFQDAQLEKVYPFGKMLLNALPRSKVAERLQLDDEVTLEYYRLSQIHDGGISLEEQGEYGIEGTREAGIGRSKQEEKEKLSRIIDVVNDKLGTDFTEADQLWFEQAEAEMLENETLLRQAQANSMDHFKHAFNQSFMDVLINRMEKNEDLFHRLMEDDQLNALAKDMMMRNFYRRANEQSRNHP